MCWHDVHFCKWCCNLYWVFWSVLFLSSWDYVYPCFSTWKYFMESYLFFGFLYICRLSLVLLVLYVYIWMSIFFFLYVDNIPFRCPEVTVSSWTRVPNYVWGMISLLVVYMTIWHFHVNMKSNVLFTGCVKHAQRRRICLILLWSWAFPSRNSTVYCCELLCFWLVSPLMPRFL